MSQAQIEAGKHLSTVKAFDGVLATLVGAAGELNVIVPTVRAGKAVLAVHAADNDTADARIQALMVALAETTEPQLQTLRGVPLVAVTKAARHDKN